MENREPQGYPVVEVVERFDAPGVWSVEAIDDDGGIAQALFIGRDAKLNAAEYAEYKYGRS